MTQQTDVLSLVEHGNALLAQSNAAQAAADFARAVQLDPTAVAGHLGLAEANLALGQLGTVYMACRQVQQLAPNSAEAATAQAMLAALDQRFEEALAEADRSISIDPTSPYVHLLRAYCLRRLGRNYDGALAEARAARTGGSRDSDYLFPQPATPVPAVAPTQAAPTGQSPWGAAPPVARPKPTWDQRSNIQRRMVRVRFATRGLPVVTGLLILVNVLAYIACAAVSRNLVTPLGQIDPSSTLQHITTNPPNPLYGNGLLVGLTVEHYPLQAYRLLTSMFLHESIIHLGVNMLSLYFVGVITERLFGAWRFTVIYFVSGIAAGILQMILLPNTASLGASGAIFGIFGAFGVYFLMRRRVIGPVANAYIGQWLFWLLLNLYFSFSSAGIALYAHLGGLAFGLVLGAIMTATLAGPKQRYS